MVIRWYRTTRALEKNISNVRAVKHGSYMIDESILLYSPYNKGKLILKIKKMKPFLVLTYNDNSFYNWSLLCLPHLRSILALFILRNSSSAFVLFSQIPELGYRSLTVFHHLQHMRKQGGENKISYGPVPCSSTHLATRREAKRQTLRKTVDQLLKLFHLTRT